MNLLKTDISELKKLQPELTIIDNKISGCFYLSALLIKGSKNKSNILKYYPWNCESSDAKYIGDNFDIDITMTEDLYPITTMSKKILSWKNNIPKEYWHVNTDDSLCLGRKRDILEMQKKYSFADFINKSLMQYFYCMCYVKKHKKEPWEADKHGLSAVLENVYNSKNIRDLDTRYKGIWQCKEEWYSLLNKTKKLKIRNRDDCPFCPVKKLSRNCTEHKKQIKGYNKLFYKLFYR